MVDFQEGILDLSSFLVDDASLFVQDDLLSAHDILVRLTNDSNQKVEQNNEQNELVHEPDGVDQEYHIVA